MLFFPCRRETTLIHVIHLIKTNVLIFIVHFLCLPTGLSAQALSQIHSLRSVGKKFISWNSMASRTWDVNTTRYLKCRYKYDKNREIHRPSAQNIILDWSCLNMIYKLLVLGCYLYQFYSSWMHFSNRTFAKHLEFQIYCLHTYSKKKSV